MRSVPALFLAAFLGACAGGAGGPPRSAGEAGAQIAPVKVTDADFAGAVGKLVIDGQMTNDRTALLHGTVRRQLERAQGYFLRGHADAGYDAVIGALYLARDGEFHPRMLEGNARPLLAAAGVAAQSGREGEALALYSMLQRVLPSGKERRDVEEHLAALKAWSGATRSSTTLQADGQTQRVTTDRALLEPTASTLREAHDATVRWIRHAIAYSREQLPPQSSFDRDEAIEMYRAVRTGALAISAIYLRQGQAARAGDAVSAEDVARVASPNLQEALASAADDDADAWYELFKTYDSYIEEASADAPVGRELARGASWGAALELYRAEPTTFRGVIPLATWLGRHWMSEAALPIIAPVAQETDDPRVLSWALNYVLQAVVNEDSTNNVQAARRIFEASAGLLDHAQKGKHAARVTPSPTRLTYVMGAIEARVGALSRARELLSASTAVEPSMPALKLLSAIDRQRGDHAAALGALDKVLAMATQAGDVTTVAETHVSMFEIHRDLGNAKGAHDALDTALRRVLDARQLARTLPDQAAAERILARILEHYGDDDGARRATIRAYEASRQDVRQVAATVLDASRRALTQGDLDGAREAARRAVEAHVPDDDLVYVALWLKLVEAQVHAPSDGTVEEVLAAAETDEAWSSALRAWGSGKINDEALFNAATSVVERTEALFYSAMATRGRGNKVEAIERLEKVATSEAIQLVEVTIARDLIADSKRPLQLSVPRDVEVP